MAVATVADVSQALGRPVASGAETEQVLWWLDGVELIIRTRLGDVALLDQTVLRYVEAEAVVAKIGRSDSRETSVTVSVDDASVTRRYESPVSASDITDEWWAMLAPDAGVGAFSVRPGFEADTTQWPVATPPNPYGRDGFDPPW